MPGFREAQSHKLADNSLGRRERSEMLHLLIKMCKTEAGSVCAQTQEFAVPQKRALMRSAEALAALLLLRK